MKKNNSNKLTEILKNVEKINVLSCQLIKEGFFAQNYMQIGDISNGELGFVKMINWSYITFNESGKSLNFILKEQYEKYDFSYKSVDEFMKNVDAIRTLFCHLLTPTENKYKSCEVFFNNLFEESYPTNEVQWQEALDYVFKKLKSLMESICIILMDMCARKSNSESGVFDIIEKWERRLKRNHHIWETEKIFYQLVDRIGFVGLNFASLNKDKNIHNAVLGHIKNLNDEYNFNTEAERVIQKILLEGKLSPLTASDIQIEFGIESGKRLGDALKWSCQEYLLKPCSKDELISRLRNYITSSKIQ